MWGVSRYDDDDEQILGVFVCVVLRLENPEKSFVFVLLLVLKAGRRFFFSLNHHRHHSFIPLHHPFVCLSFSFLFDCIKTRHKKTHIYPEKSYCDGEVEKKACKNPPWKTQKKVLSFLCCVRACCVARASCRVPLLKYVTAEWKCSQLFYHLSFSLCAWRIALCSFHHSRAGQGRRDVFHLTNFFPACCNGNIKARFFIIIIIICFPFLCPPCPLYHHSC